MILYALYVAAIFFPCHPYIWSTTVLHDNTHVHEQTVISMQCGIQNLNLFTAWILAENYIRCSTKSHVMSMHREVDS